jgi:hypothetical protein
MNARTLLLTGWALLLAAGTMQASQQVDSEIRRVTLYRGTAMVTRSVSVPDSTGELELVVGNLPAQIQPPSLHATGKEGLSVRSVRFRTRVVKDVPQKELLELQQQLKDLQRQQQELDATLGVLGQREAYLKNMEDFAAPTAKAQLTEAKLDPKSLIEVSEYIFEQRRALAKETTSLQQKKQDLQEDLAFTQRKIGEVSGDGSRVLREAVVFVEKTAQGPSTIQLSYLVSNAGWSPSYKAVLNDGEVDLAYVARVSQATGEDWSGVELTLSTASPQMNAEIPLLVPMWVHLMPESSMPRRKPQPQPMAQQRAARGVDMDLQNNVLGEVKSQQYSQLLSWQNNAPSPDNRLIGWRMNELANASQRLELNFDRDEIIRMQEQLRFSEAALAVTYHIDGPLSLESRNDVQLVEIAAETLKADSYYQACPLLGGYVFRGADVTNTTGIPLLGGTYDAYIGNEFVGRGRIPLVAKGQPVSLGFGMDTQLRCSRELKDKSDKTFLGSRIQTFEYVLRIESFKDTPVTVRLVDRMPTTQDDDMDIKFEDASQPLAKTDDYTSRQREQGLLMWQVEVPARSIDATARTVTYSYETKFASDRSVGRALMERSDKARQAYDAAYDANQ